MCYRSVQLGISKDYSHFESPEFFGCSRKNLADCSQNLALLPSACRARQAVPVKRYDANVTANQRELSVT